MSSSKKIITNALIGHALTGTPNVTVLKIIKERFNLTDNELDWALETCNFNQPPKKIAYDIFFDNNITKVAQKVNTSKIQLYYINNFITPIDCQLLKGYIDQTAQPSTVHTPGEGDDKRTRTESIRSSSSVLMDWKTNEFFKFIDRKIVNLMQLHPFIGEGITGQKYEIGEFYRTHPDYFIDSDLETYCTWMGQRTWTTMLYLNDVEKGGETQFPNINIKMKPKEGTLIAWNNLNIDGTNNENTLHEALPPESGKKYVITKWWRSWNLI